MTSELGDRFETHTLARTELFDYIELFYNQERRHSALGYRSLCGRER
jgi:putative transposase